MCFVPGLLKYLLDAPVNRRVNGARGWGDPLYLLALHRLLSSIRPKNDGVKLEWISSSAPASDDTQKLVFAFCTRPPNSSSSSSSLSCQFCRVTIFVDETFLSSVGVLLCVLFLLCDEGLGASSSEILLAVFFFFSLFFFFSFGSKFPCESFRVKT